MTVKAAVLTLRYDGLDYKSVVQLETAVEAALKGALNAKSLQVDVQTVEYDERSEEIIRTAVEGLTSFYPNLAFPDVLAFVRKEVTVPDTGNDQSDYEATRDQVEQAVEAFAVQDAENSEEE